MSYLILLSSWLYRPGASQDGGGGDDEVRISKVQYNKQKRALFCKAVLCHLLRPIWTRRHVGKGWLNDNRNWRERVRASESMYMCHHHGQSRHDIIIQQLDKIALLVLSIIPRSVLFAHSPFSTARYCSDLEPPQPSVARTGAFRCVFRDIASGPCSLHLAYL